MKVEHTLRQLPSYAHFDQEALELLATSLELRTFGPGDTVLEAGADADGLYLVLEGTTEIVLEAEGKRRVLGTEGPGSLVGLIGMLRGVKRSADVVAQGTLRVGVLNRYAFDILYGRSLAFCRLVTGKLVRDARHVSEAILVAIEAPEGSDAHADAHTEVSARLEHLTAH